MYIDIVIDVGVIVVAGIDVAIGISSVQCFDAGECGLRPSV